jgi:hypothetical protein
MLPRVSIVLRGALGSYYLGVLHGGCFDDVAFACWLPSREFPYITVLMSNHFSKCTIAKYKVITRKKQWKQPIKK